MNELALRNEFNLSKAKRVFDAIDVSESTRVQYKRAIKPFLEFLSINNFNRNSFLDFKRELEKRVDISISTKNSYLISARVFSKELHRMGHIPDIVSNVKTFKQSKKHKKTGLTENEVQRVIEALKDFPGTGFKISRLRCLFSLFLLQGLRQNEVHLLDVSDIDFKENRLLVKSKGQDGKQPIPLHPETAKVLKTYLQTWQIKSGALFQSQSNNSKNNRLSTNSIRQIITKYLKLLDIDKSTHSARHFFVTRLLKSFKSDLITVQKFTRHKSLEMLTVYNDDIETENSLPIYHQTFENLSF